MLANTLISELRNKGYSIRADGDYLDICPGDLPHEVIAQLKNAKVEILAELKREVQSNDYPSYQKSVYGFTMLDLEKIAAQDWGWVRSNSQTLKDFAHACLTLGEMKNGKAPAHYTSVTRCKSCGEVSIPPGLKNNGYVLGCPWCSTDFPITKH